MYSFIPPPYVKEYQRYNNRRFEDISEKDLDDIAQKITAMQSDQPLITIGLIAWNEQDHILATLCSLAKSRCSMPLEILVVNNNSTDDTQKFIDRCGVISVQEKRQGYAYARQAGLKAARGKYFLSGDTDTIYSPDWAELMVQPLLKDEVVCTYGLHAFYSEDGKYPLNLQLYQYAKLLNIYAKHIARPQLNCGGASMAFKKNEAMKFGGYNTEIVRGSDGYIALQLSKYGKIEMVSDQKAVIYTSMRRTVRDGSLLQAFLIRLRHNLRYLLSNFTRQRDN